MSQRVEPSFGFSQSSSSQRIGPLALPLSRELSCVIFEPNSACSYALLCSALLGIASGLEDPGAADSMR
jgi:hypothetical protein